MNRKTLATLTATTLILGLAGFASAKFDDHGTKKDTKAPATTTAEPKKTEAKTDTKATEKPGAAAVVGQPAPDFTLMDMRGESVKLSTIGKGKVVLIEWFNPECPFIVKHHEKNTTFADLQKDFGSKGVVFLAINSSAPGKEGNGVDKNINAAKTWKIGYPILNDEDGKIGKLYGAKTTPHVFIINKEGVLAFAGAIDNNSSPDKAGDVNYARKALTEILAGQTVTEPETKPYGCPVKYGK